MGRVNKCCNPINKKNHNNVLKKLVLIRANRACQFKAFIGKYMCNSCERAIYLGREPEILKNTCNKPINNDPIGDATEPEVDKIRDDDKKDPTFKCDAIDNQLKIEKVNKLLSEVGEPPIKLRRVSSVAECKKAILTSVRKFSGNDINNDNSSDVLLNNFKSAFDKKTSRSEKIQVLTTLPLDWSIKMIRREFKVSKRMVQAAKNMRKNSGFASLPDSKKGKNLDNSTLDRVKNFYLSDDVSRVMPGIKDYVTVLENGKKIQKQKRLLLFNIHDLYKKFKETYPDEKIGQTKFQTLRPRECISAGKSGTHNVCVCKIHQNVKLQLHGLKNELKKKGVDCTESSNDLIQSSVCAQPTSSCFFSTCKKCPEVDAVINKLKLLIESHEIKEISFSQWKSTDR